MVVPVLQVIAEAYQELNVFMPGASIPPAQATLALSKLRQLLNFWNAQRHMVWAEIFRTGTLVPSLSPHTIGPTGATFTVSIRPVSIEGFSLNLNTNTPDVFVPINIIDSQEYEALSVPGISTAIPIAVYYETDWPNGKLFFYPIPNFAYPVRWRSRMTLADDVDLTDSLDFPPGYQLAYTYTLAELLATPSGRAVPLQTAKMAREARAVVGANNTTIPLLDMQDGQQESKRTSFNYHSREFS